MAGVTAAVPTPKRADQSKKRKKKKKKGKGKKKWPLVTNHFHFEINDTEQITFQIDGTQMDGAIQELLQQLRQQLANDNQE